MTEPHYTIYYDDIRKQMLLVCEKCNLRSYFDTWDGNIPKPFVKIQSNNKFIEACPNCDYEYIIKYNITNL